jgi:hypothetical protein
LIGRRLPPEAPAQRRQGDDGRIDWGSKAGRVFWHYFSQAIGGEEIDLEVLAEKIEAGEYSSLVVGAKDEEGDDESGRGGGERLMTFKEVSEALRVPIEIVGAWNEAEEDFEQ